MKTRLNNKLANHTSAVYAENNTELSWPIESDAIYDENWIGQ